MTFFSLLFDFQQKDVNSLFFQLLLQFVLLVSFFFFLVAKWHLSLCWVGKRKLLQTVIGLVRKGKKQNVRLSLYGYTSLYAFLNLKLNGLMVTFS